MKVIDAFHDGAQGTIYTVELAPGRMVDIKHSAVSDVLYVMQNGDGSTVYGPGGTDDSFPDYKYDEPAAMKLVRAAIDNKEEKRNMSDQNTNRMTARRVVVYSMPRHVEDLNKARALAEQAVRMQLDSDVEVLAASTVIVPDDDFAQWQDFADEHILLMRPINPVDPTDFEYIKVSDQAGDPDHLGPGEVFFFHGVISVQDYLEAESALNELLNGFGYADLDAFVKENSPDDNWVYGADGKLDRENSPSYIIDIQLLASLIAESLFYEGIRMPRKKAKELVKRYTGLDYNV